MDGFDEADLALVESENHGRSANAVAKESDAFEEITVSNAGTGKNHFPAGSKVSGVVNALGIFDAHFFQALVMLRCADDKARENLAIEAAKRGGGENALRCGVQKSQRVAIEYFPKSNARLATVGEVATIEFQ